jgi:short-subunit dehydrogenase
MEESFYMAIQGKVVVVTGASMGIGEEVARTFLRQGASVVLASREQGRVEEARQRIGAGEHNSMAVACDVRDRSQIDNLIQQTMQRFGRIDVWVNNAGYGLVGSVEKMDMEECRRMFDTNLFGAVECMQAVIPIMKRQRSGAIINISSVAGHIAVPYMAAYGATKHALNCFSKAARLELRDAGIDVITICPGYVNTSFNKNAVRGQDERQIASNLKRGITSQRVAEAVLRAYQERSREVIVPRSNAALVLFYALAPLVIEWGMMKFMGGNAKKQPQHVKVQQTATP